MAQSAVTSPMNTSGILHNLFAPLPDTRVEQRKDVFDHVANYADTANGAWDVFRIGNHIFAALEMCLSPAHHLNGAVGKVKEVFNTAGIGLSIPQLFTDVNNLRRSVKNLFVVPDLPFSDPLRSAKVAQAAKKSFLDSLTLTNTLAQIILFIDNAKIYALKAAHLAAVDGVYNLTSGITDSAEGIGEYFKLKQYHSPESQPRNALEAAKLKEKKTLAWITIAKDVASVALAAIALGTLYFGVAASSVALISFTTLTLSAFWLGTKLTAYFYNKIVVEAPPPAPAIV